MISRPRIFISAVSKELRGARQLIANTLQFLGYEPVWQDIFGTEQGDLRETLRRQIDSCRGVVQVLGQCYGAEPPEPDEQFGRVSYTQYEALYARQRDKRVWYLVLDREFPTDPHETEPAELQSLQAAYRQKIQADTHLFHPVTSSEGLKAKVHEIRDDLARLRRRFTAWAAGVIGLLILISGLLIWLVLTVQEPVVIKDKNADTAITARNPSNTLEFLSYLSQTLSSQNYQDRIANEDPWTSRPLTIAVLPVELHGDATLDSPQVAHLLDLISDPLSSIPGVELIERDRILKVLEEMGFGSSALVGDETFLRLGKMLAARFLALPKASQEGNQSLFSIRLVECETTRIIARGYSLGPEPLATLASKVMQEIPAQLQKKVPLQGRILQISDSNVFLNIGKKEGIWEHQRFEVIGEDPQFTDNPLTEVIGLLEVTQVDDAASVAAILEKKFDLQPNCRVRVKP